MKTNDTVWYITGVINFIPVSLWKKRFPLPPSSIPPSAKSFYAGLNPYKKLSSKLQNIKTYSTFYKDWVTAEGTLPPVTVSDCKGHFDDYPALAHSTMIFHSCDLLGKAIEKLTGRRMNWKSTDFGQEHGLKLLSFDCTPENLHFANTHALKFQVKAYLSTGEMGKPESTYVVECCAVQDVTGVVCFKATGCFALSPILFTKVAFRNALAAGDVATIWKKADANGDGVISREELQQFISSSDLPELDEKSVNMSFKYLDTFERGYISFDEFKGFCASLQENYYGRSSGVISVNEDVHHDSSVKFPRPEFPLNPAGDTAVINSYNGTLAFV